MKSAQKLVELVTLPLASAAFLLAVYSSCDVVTRQETVQTVAMTKTR